MTEVRGRIRGFVNSQATVESYPPQGRGADLPNRSALHAVVSTDPCTHTPLNLKALHDESWNKIEVLHITCGQRLFAVQRICRNEHVIDAGVVG